MLLAFLQQTTDSFLVPQNLVARSLAWRAHNNLHASSAVSSDLKEAVLACAKVAARTAGALIIAGRGADVRELKANSRDLLTEVGTRGTASLVSELPL